MFEFQGALREAARDFPTTAYIRHRNLSVTFSDTVSAISQIASQLPPLAGRRVVILLPDGLPAALINLTCFHQGATLVPISPFSSQGNIEYVLERIRPELVFTTPLLLNRFSEPLKGAAVVLVGTDDPVGLEFQSPPGWRNHRNQNHPSPVRAVFFTSGTTGKPKGVCLSEQSLLSAAYINQSILELDSRRRSLIMVPPYDYYGFIQLYSHLAAKATCTVGESGQFPRSALDLIRSHAVTDVVLVPFTLRSIVGCLGKSSSGAHLEGWRNVANIASSSDYLSSDVLHSTFTISPQVRIVNVYGLTEAGRACYRSIYKDSEQSNSIGKPSPMMNVWVDAATGHNGEIVISGPTVMLGYFSAIVDDEIHFTPVSEIRTADEGYVDPNGELHLLGRKDHLINLYGIKLHPTEIELPVTELPGVRECVAQVHQHEDGTKTIILNVVADPGCVEQNQILDVLRRQVPAPFVPKEINFVESIARTEIGGKVIRSKN